MQLSMLGKLLLIGYAGKSLTSGVNMERGTRVQKKPRETQCVANLRMPK